MKGYIDQPLTGRKILVFVREQNEDEYGNTLSYVFLGEADFVKTSEAKPMNVEWRLQETMPAYIWKESGKLAVVLEKKYTFRPFIWKFHNIDLFYFPPIQIG